MRIDCDGTVLDGRMCNVGHQSLIDFNVNNLAKQDTQNATDDETSAQCPFHSPLKPNKTIQPLLL